VHLSRIPGHSYAYFAVMAGVFITAFYSFRLLFLAFHGTPRFAHGSAHAAFPAEPADQHGHHDEGPPRESPWVVTIPLILLAIPSIYSGWAYIEPLLFGDYFGSSIVVRPEHAVVAQLAADWHGVVAFVVHGLTSVPFWLAVAGIVAAWYCYIVNPAVPGRIRSRVSAIYTLLDNKYYLDRFNDWFFAGGSRAAGGFLSNVGDRAIIDGFFVNGSGRVVQWISALLRQVQSGYVYHYAFTMIVGVFAFLTWWIIRSLNVE